MRRAIVALAVVGLTLVSGAGAASARPAKPKITVTPDSGITTGMKLTVVVRRAGLSGVERPIYECTSDDAPPLVSHCTLLKHVYTGVTGGFRARVTAIVGPVGTVGGRCDADHSCLIVTFTTSTTKPPMSAPISFASSRARI
jgi:hypothetical protein